MVVSAVAPVAVHSDVPALVLRRIFTRGNIVPNAAVFRIQTTALTVAPDGILPAVFGTPAAVLNSMIFFSPTAAFWRFAVHDGLRHIRSARVELLESTRGRSLVVQVVDNGLTKPERRKAREAKDGHECEYATLSDAKVRSTVLTHGCLPQGYALEETNQR